MIYTIGYQLLTPAALAAIAARLDATVIDCRLKPVSRVPGFGGRQLAALLGSRYQQHGHHLGGYGHTTAEGIDFLCRRQGCLLLLCMEEAPGDCHRHHAICAPHFPDALHIYRDEIFTAGELRRAIDDDDEYALVGSLPDLLRESA